jgi:hypothetical protein
MASIPPQINTSSQGKPAGSNISTNTSYQAMANASPNNLYKNYNFPNMYTEQAGKNNGTKLRFSITCNSFTFQAHIDPEHLIDEQGKRIVQIDVLTGIVLQDFGYTVQAIELRGTTGAAYYDEIDALDRVFNNQSTGGVPTPATLVLESRTYTGVFTRFEFDRIVRDNRYTYVIGFTVLQRGKTYNNSNFNYASAVVAARKAQNSIGYGTGLNQTTYIDYAGQTPNAYASANSNIPLSQKGIALTYLAAQWSTAPQNANRSYPGDYNPLNANEVLVVPINWNSVLTGNASTPSSSQSNTSNYTGGAVTNVSQNS